MSSSHSTSARSSHASYHAWKLGYATVNVPPLALKSDHTSPRRGPLTARNYHGRVPPPRDWTTLKPFLNEASASAWEGAVVRLAVATCVSAVVMFAWSGLSQALPWGVSTVRNFVATGEPPDPFAAQATAAAPLTYTTPAFDEALGRGVSTLTTEASFAWVVSIPREAYDPVRYLLVEAASQLAVAAALVAAWAAMAGLAPAARARVILLLGAAGAAATYGVMANWWGLPPAYALGMSVNLLVGWSAATAVTWALTRGRA